MRFFIGRRNAVQKDLSAFRIPTERALLCSYNQRPNHQSLGWQFLDYSSLRRKVLILEICSSLSFQQLMMSVIFWVFHLHYKLCERFAFDQQLNCQRSILRDLFTACTGVIHENCRVTKIIWTLMVYTMSRGCVEYNSETKETATQFSKLKTCRKVDVRLL